MTRLSRDQKRGRSASGAASEGGAETGTAPIEVRVPAAPGAETTLGGTPVAVGPDQEAQEVVLDHLHRRALATGRPVVATVHDERIGYVVAIRVYVDGSSEYAAEPVRMDTAGTADAPQAPRHDEPTHGRRPVDAEEAAPGASAPTFPLRALPEPSGPSAPQPPTASRPSPPAGVPGGPGMPGVQSPGVGTGTSLPGAAPESTGSRPARPAGPSPSAPSVPPPVPATPPITPTARPAAPPATGAPAATAPQPAPAPASVVWASAPAAPDRPVPSPAAPSAPTAGPRPAPASPAMARATGPVPSDRPASAPAASSVRSSPSAPCRRPQHPRPDRAPLLDRSPTRPAGTSHRGVPEALSPPSSCGPSPRTPR
ncbi:Agglutinin receptor [Streptomyces sp. MBT84]|nr:Agglutinin receptor [Streptomyces sp. MBT84]